MGVQELAERIERAQGSPKDLALVLTDALTESRNDLVTNATLARELAGVRGEIQGIEHRLTAKLDAALREQTRWIIGVVIASVVLLGAILKLL